MLAATRRLIEQLARWDAVEGCWEVFIPSPIMVKTTLEDGVNIIDVALEVDKIMEPWEMTEYNNVGGGDGEVWIAGIS